VTDGENEGDDCDEVIKGINTDKQNQNEERCSAIAKQNQKSKD